MQKIKEEIIQGYQVSYFIYPQTLQNINQKYFIVPAYMLIKKEKYAFLADIFEILDLQKISVQDPNYYETGYQIMGILSNDGSIAFPDTVLGFSYLCPYLCSLSKDEYYASYYTEEFHGHFAHGCHFSLKKGEINLLKEGLPSTLKLTSNPFLLSDHHHFYNAKKQTLSKKEYAYLSDFFLLNNRWIALACEKEDQKLTYFYIDEEEKICSKKKTEGESLEKDSKVFLKKKFL